MVKPFRVAIVGVLLIHGCGDQAPPATSPAEGESKPSPWAQQHDPAVPVAENDAEMSAAIAQARATAEGARAQFNAAGSQDRERWSVKWAAPTVAGEIEHVWVNPINWSPFRMEGWLASEPARELVCGKKIGDIVSFPIEELSDWVHFTGDSAAGQKGEFDGGFTIKVLAKRYGPPPPPQP